MKCSVACGAGAVFALCENGDAGSDPCSRLMLTRLAVGLGLPSAPGAAAPHAPSLRLRGKVGPPLPWHSATALSESKNCGECGSAPHFRQAAVPVPVQSLAISAPAACCPTHHRRFPSACASRGAGRTRGSRRAGGRAWHSRSHRPRSSPVRARMPRPLP